MNRLESAVEKIIREAMEQGEFDNLQGKGQPIDLRENPFEDPDLRTAHRLLRNAGFAPAWLEERKDIDARLEERLTTLRRAWKIYGEGHPEWERNLSDFRDSVAELNQRIRIYNLKAPAAVFHRVKINGEQLIRQVCVK
jgi:DnaJ family protein C protein 28